MDRWRNRIAVVTGASSGIGAACCLYLVKNGMIVVGLARRKDRIEELRNQLKLNDEKLRLHGMKCDIRQEAEICQVFSEIEKSLGPIAVLVNNAGVLCNTQLLAENNTEDLRSTLDTNVLGIALCTREAFRSMKKQGDGHVVLINSICGHRVLLIPNHSMNLYPPSKHAVTAMTEIYRQEFQMHNTKCRVTSISPGGVDTEVFTGDFRKAFEGIAYLRPEDVADAVIYCLQTPPHVQIHEMIIKPLGETI